MNDQQQDKATTARELARRAAAMPSLKGNVLQTAVLIDELSGNQAVQVAMENVVPALEVAKSRARLVAGTGTFKRTVPKDHMTKKERRREKEARKLNIIEEINKPKEE